MAHENGTPTNDTRPPVSAKPTPIESVATRPARGQRPLRLAVVATVISLGGHALAERALSPDEIAGHQLVCPSVDGTAFDPRDAATRAFLSPSGGPVYARLLVAPSPKAGPEVGRHRLSESPRPNERGTMHPRLRVLLDSAFSRATDLLASRPACRALFGRLGTDGHQLLSATMYYQARPAQQAVCSHRHALAFTFLSSPVTHLCPVFTRLHPVDGALVLIHEALHFAGLPESPWTPGALTSERIQEIVTAGCSPRADSTQPS